MIHAMSMFFAMDQFTRLSDFAAPTPIMADVLQWPVDTRHADAGSPQPEVNVVEKFAARP